MTDDDPFPHHAALVKDIPAPQRAHGAYRRDAPRKTVLRAAVLPPESVVRVLEIGQPYIHRVPRRADDGGIVAAVAVPHNGQFTSRFELFKHGNEPFRPRSRSDEVDVLGALFFEVEHEPEKVVSRHRDARAAPRYHSVLAEDTTHIAARKKDRAAPAAARDAGFLEKVKSDARHSESFHTASMHRGAAAVNRLPARACARFSKICCLGGRAVL